MRSSGINCGFCVDGSGADDGRTTPATGPESFVGGRGVGRSVPAVGCDCGMAEERGSDVADESSAGVDDGVGVAGSALDVGGAIGTGAGVGAGAARGGGGAAGGGGGAGAGVGAGGAISTCGGETSVSVTERAPGPLPLLVAKR